LAGGGGGAFRGDGQFRFFLKPRAFALAAMMVPVVSPFLGLALDRLGPRRVILPCCVLAILPVGKYAVTVEAPGFAPFVRKPVRLSVSHVVQLPVGQALAASTQSGQIAAGALAVETMSNVVGKTVTTRGILDLPLNGQRGDSGPVAKLTLVVDEGLLREVRRIATDRGTTVSQFAGGLLEPMVRQESSRGKAGA
jgi:hypothetical protein